MPFFSRLWERVRASVARPDLFDRQPEDFGGPRSVFGPVAPAPCMLEVWRVSPTRGYSLVGRAFGLPLARHLARKAGLGVYAANTADGRTLELIEVVPCMTPDDHE